jgi:hypothetical protein
MKNFRLACSTMTLLYGFFSLAMLTGCQTFQDTSFAPLDAKLEPIHAGGAQHFILVNISGQALHNFRFRAYMWDDNTITYRAGDFSSLPNRLPAMTYTFDGSGSKWESGQVQRFVDRNIGGEISILKPVSKVQIVGSSDEGRFREYWLINGVGQLLPVGRKAKD